MDILIALLNFTYGLSRGEELGSSLPLLVYNEEVKLYSSLP